jgi:hypothetical protein
MMYQEPPQRSFHPGEQPWLAPPFPPVRLSLASVSLQQLLYYLL